MSTSEKRDVTDPRAEGPLGIVLEALGDVVETPPAAIDPTAVLTALGIDSYTAVRLRRRLFEDTDVDLELTEFLGAATATSIAARIGRSRPAPAAVLSETPPNIHSADDSFALGPVQQAYLV